MVVNLVANWVKYLNM